MSKHTPGPWLVKPRAYGRLAVEQLATEKWGKNRVLAHVPPQYGKVGPDVAANALLMAEAPHLLRALYEVDALATRHGRGAIGRAQQIARAAIAKAEGR